MINSSTNSKKPSGPLKSTKRPKPDRRWTLLFIGNRGRTITLKRFKGMVLFALCILGTAIAVAVSLFLWNQDIIREKHQLEANLRSLKDELKVMRDEKDILMTRLVLAESQVQRNADATPKKQSQEEPVDMGKNESGATEETTEPASKTVEVPVKKPPPPKEDDDPPASGLSVAVENFKISNSSSSNKLRVQFKIKNTSPNSQYVSGHAIVVLKGDQLEKSSWMSIPRMPLDEGKPSGRHRGYSFGINYFRTMRFSGSSPKFPEKYQTASVYVFTSNGELLIEQDFAVQLSGTQ